MRRARRRRTPAPPAEAEPSEGSEFDTYRAVWLALSPAQRLRRSWRMRARLKDIETTHDEKSLPKL